MSLFEIRLKALSGEELAQFLPGMLVSELFYAEVNLACTPHEDSREIRDYIDQLYLLGKRHVPYSENGRGGKTTPIEIL